MLYRLTGQTLTAMSTEVIKQGTKGGAVSLTFLFDAEWSEYPIKVCAFGFDGNYFDSVVRIKTDSAPIPDVYCDKDFYICVIGLDEQKKLTSEIEKVTVV